MGAVWNGDTEIALRTRAQGSPLISRLGMNALQYPILEMCLRELHLIPTS